MTAANPEPAMTEQRVRCPSCGGGNRSCGCCHGAGIVSAETAKWWAEQEAVDRPGGRPPFAMSKPCPECPWRTDVPTGRFKPSRFSALKGSCEQGLHNPMFACHKSKLAEERACAGFLLVEGQNNLQVRLAMIQGRLKPSDIADGGHPLYPSFEAMAVANGVPED